MYIPHHGKEAKHNEDVTSVIVSFRIFANAVSESFYWEAILKHYHYGHIFTSRDDFQKSSEYSHTAGCLLGYTKPAGNMKLKWTHTNGCSALSAFRPWPRGSIPKPNIANQVENKNLDRALNSLPLQGPRRGRGGGGGGGGSGERGLDTFDFYLPTIPIPEDETLPKTWHFQTF